MEIVILIVLSITVIATSFTDGPNLTEEIDSLFYMKNKEEELKIKQNEVPKVEHNQPVKPNITKQNISNRKEVKDGNKISSSISMESINNIIDDSDNLGDNPHSFYTYE